MSAKKLLLFFGLLISGLSLCAQVDSIQPPVGEVALDTVQKVKKAKKDKEPKKLTIANYKIINYQRDTVFLDTSLTIQKEYKYNFLRKDDFELMPFANVGGLYNSLGASFREPHFYPKLGARARHFGFFEKEDVTYYNVATPMTELFFKTTLERGRLLDAKLTFNTSERFNFSMAYIGFSSLGKYQWERSESGRFRATFNYVTLNNRYAVRGHFASQDLGGEENGGLANKELQFESGDTDFNDRARIDVAYSNAFNTVLSKRYFFDHQFNLVRPRRDSLKNRTTTLSIGHQFNYETKFYQYKQSSPNTSFGNFAIESRIDDKASLRTMFNQLSANFSNKILGRLSGSLNFYNYDYSFRSLLILPSGTIPSQLKANEFAVGGDYWNKIGPLELKGKLRYNIAGDLGGTLFDAQASYQLTKKHKLFGSIYGASRMPNFNALLYQSDYFNFNWFNQNNFDKQRVQSIEGGVDSKFFGKLTANFSTLDNYTFFGLDETALAEAEEALEEGQTIANRLNSFVRPFQASGTVNHLKLTYQKELTWRKWALNNTLMYQNVTQDAQVLNLPEIVTRNTLYFSSDVFDKAMYLQTGVTFKYFSAYNMNAYNPLLAEFYTQNREKLGAYPLIDVFINAKVRQTRLYLKAEHLNTVWGKERNYYAAPNYPYRDFVIRFGLVWNFFS